MGDVTTIEHAVEVNLRRSIISALPRRGEIVAERADGQDAAAAADYRVVAPLRRGMEDLRSGRRRRIEPGDRVAGAHRAGIAVGRENDAERRARIPARP